MERSGFGGRAGLALFVAGSLSCGGSSTSATPTAKSVLRGTVSDPAGDSAIPNGADLTGATLEVTDGTLTATITFAPGTLTPSNALVLVFLDTDENPATGFRVTGDSTIGWDYALSILNPQGSSQASIDKPDQPGRTVSVGTAKVLLVSPDQVQVAVPMTLLSGDGHLKFRVAVARWDLTSGTLDYAPELNTAPGVVQ